MKCYECKWLDRSVILTSIPPQYGCTLGFGSHYADHECEYDFMPIVRCEDCRHRNTWDNPRLDPQYYRCGKGVKFRDYGYVREDDYCPLGERREK